MSQRALWPLTLSTVVSAQPSIWGVSAGGNGESQVALFFIKFLSFYFIFLKHYFNALNMERLLYDYGTPKD